MKPEADQGEQPAQRFSLRRWSQRKLEAARAQPAPVVPSEAPPVPIAAQSPPHSDARPTVEPQLPPIESLTIDSDFTLFMQPNVDATLRRAALKQLFRDPRFNVMDGLDTYIDDYTKADPIPEELVRKLAHARAIFDPPPTMLTPEGYVVDAPIAPAALAAQADPLPPADTSTSEAESLKPESPASALEYPKQDS